MKVFDLFCGTGGFSYGFKKSEKHSFDVVLGIDLNMAPIKTFGANHKNAIAIQSDIRKLSKSEIMKRIKLRRGELDLIIGGPPCQGFSSIRPFRSTNDDDPRNNLFEEFASFVNFFRPKAFVLENVVGIITHKGGQSLESMIKLFSSLGYNTDWKILNAAHYGVPQKRERFVMIGTEKGAGQITFPKPLYVFNGNTIGYKDKSKMIMIELQDNLFESTIQDRLPKAITAFDAISDLPKLNSGENASEYILPPQNNYQKERRKGSKSLTLHSATAHTAKMLEIIRHSGKNIYSLPKGLVTSGFSSCYSRIAPDEPAVTITVNFVHPASNRCIHPFQDRALTPREGARLQSFDDDFVFWGNRSQIVKQIGNAVPPLLGKAIADSLWENIAL